MKWAQHAIIPVTILMVIAIVAYARMRDVEEVVTPEKYEVSEVIPDFGSYTDVKAKKKDFFDYMLPMIRNANSRVMEQRKRLQDIGARLESGKSLTGEDSEFLADIATRYKIKTGETIDAGDVEVMLTRVDIVPASLILAQAANESAWGTSRFARNAHNFFGIWCFTPGCGLTPRYRDEGLTHEVKSFATVQDGVDWYLRIINTNNAYEELREIRARLRETGQPLLGSRLAEGLLRYSERGEAYVEEIQAMIRINELRTYNLAANVEPAPRG